jgi:hypothetical protein
VWLALPLIAQAQFSYIDNGDSTCAITVYTGSDNDVVIPEMIDGLTVTSILRAFNNKTSITNVIIPNSVTSIRTEAFNYCTSLMSVNIPNSVTNIGDEAFQGCRSLTSVTIGNNVINIGDFTFYDCTSMTSVTIPNSVTNIGTWAFVLCSSLTSVTIPNSVTSMGDFAFGGCTNLNSAYFKGNGPPDNGTAFKDDPASVYHLLGTHNWGYMFGSRITTLWNPQAHTPGFIGRQFCFNLTGPTNAVIVVDACTNLSNPVWLPIATNIFSASGTSTFTDPSSQPSRFYRFRSP